MGQKMNDNNNKTKGKSALDRENNDSNNYKLNTCVPNVV